MRRLIDWVRSLRDGDNRRAALEAVLKAWADECERTVPVHLGVLKGSIRYVVDSETSGHLEFVHYGQIIATRVPVLSQLPRNVRQRMRYAQEVGRQVQHPNEWYQAAWESDAVQEAIRAYPALLFTRR
jgi:hypothetical protein